jgi:hypothetical protein
MVEGWAEAGKSHSCFGGGDLYLAVGGAPGKRGRD